MWKREVGVMRDEPKLGMGQPNRADTNICNRFRSMGGGGLLSTSFFLLARSKQGMESVFPGLSLSMGYDAGRFRALWRADRPTPSVTHAKRWNGVFDRLADSSCVVYGNVLSVGSIASGRNAGAGETSKSNLFIAGVCRDGR